MSVLIDLFGGPSENLVEINGKWYKAKPINNLPFKDRIKDSIKVLTGKAIAVHFKEDESKGRRKR